MTDIPKSKYVRPRRSSIKGSPCLSIFAIRDRIAQRTYPARCIFMMAMFRNLSRTPTKSTSVVVYCYHGNSSLGATAYFIENGFKTSQV